LADSYSTYTTPTRDCRESAAADWSFGLSKKSNSFGVAGQYWWVPTEQRKPQPRMSVNLTTYLAEFACMSDYPNNSVKQPSAEAFHRRRSFSNRR